MDYLLRALTLWTMLHPQRARQLQDYLHRPGTALPVSCYQMGGQTPLADLVPCWFDTRPAEARQFFAALVGRYRYILGPPASVILREHGRQASRQGPPVRQLARREGPRAASGGPRAASGGPVAAKGTFWDQYTQGSTGPVAASGGRYADAFDTLRAAL